MIPKSKDKITFNLSNLISEIAKEIELFYQGYLELESMTQDDVSLKKYDGGFFIFHKKRKWFSVARIILEIRTKIHQEFWTASIDKTVSEEVREKILLIFQKKEKDLLKAGIRIVILNQ